MKIFKNLMGDHSKINISEIASSDGKMIVDFVVEQGENYMKWASGRLECWTNIPYTKNVAMEWISSGNYSRSDTFEWIFPVEFVRIPVLTHSTLDFSNSDFVGARAIDGTKASYRYISFLNKTQTNTYVFGMKAEGRWK